MPYISNYFDTAVGISSVVNTLNIRKPISRCSNAVFFLMLSLIKVHTFSQVTTVVLMARDMAYTYTICIIGRSAQYGDGDGGGLHKQCRKLPTLEREAGGEHIPAGHY